MENDYQKSMNLFLADAAQDAVAVVLPAAEAAADQTRGFPDSPAAAGTDAGTADGEVSAEQGGSAAEATLPDSSKLRIAIKTLKAMEQSLANVLRLLEEKIEVGAAVRAAGAADDPSAREFDFTVAANAAAGGQVIEGVFDGLQMIGADGRSYSVPPNYASKSKLVEGDLLKLTITSRGSFIYKQIGPTDRDRIVAELGFDQTIGEYYAASDKRRWNILKASVTYFKGEAGDEIVILVPKNAPSKWAAAENIIKRDPLAQF